MSNTWQQKVRDDFGWYVSGGGVIEALWLADVEASDTGRINEATASRLMGKLRQYQSEISGNDTLQSSLVAHSMLAFRIADTLGGGYMLVVRGTGVQTLPLGRETNPTPWWKFWVRPQRRSVPSKTTHTAAPLALSGKVKALVGRLAKSDSSTVAWAVEKELAALRDPESIQQMIIALKHPSPRVMHHVAGALHDIGDSRAAPALVAALSYPQQYAGEHPAARALAKIGDVSVVPDLMAKLSEADATVRSAAVYALGCLRDARAASAVADLLRADPDKGVRQEAAEALGRMPCEAAVVALLAALSDSMHIQMKAMYALGYCGDERAIEPLIGLLRHPSADLRLTAANVLGSRFVGARSIAPLAECLSDVDRYVREQAVESLKRLAADGHSEAKRRLLERL